MYSTQLSDFKTYDTDNLILQPTERRTTTQRVRMMTHNLDGTKGDLIFSTPRFLSFGVQPIQDGQEVIGYQMPFVLWDRNGPTHDEQLLVDVLERITTISKKYVLEHREELDRPELTEDDLDHMNLLYYKKGEDKKAPLLYVKLNTFRNEDDILIRTLFIDDTTKQTIDPMSLMNKRCLVQAAIRFESIVIGNKVRFQLKLLEAKIKMLDRGYKSFLEPGKTFKPFQEKNNKNNL